VKASPVVNFSLTGRVVDWSEIEARGYYDGFANDPELRAYGRQLALENGFSVNIQGNVNGLERHDEIKERKHKTVSLSCLVIFS
jgi:hypothetical protein